MPHLRTPRAGPAGWNEPFGMNPSRSPTAWNLGSNKKADIVKMDTGE